jgi:hypothetical protein
MHGRNLHRLSSGAEVVAMRFDSLVGSALAQPGPAVPTAYMERIVPVPAEEAARGLEVFLEELAVRAGDGRRPVLLVPGGRLIVAGRLARPERRDRSALWPLRSAPGVVVAASGWCRTRVELELLAWSERSSAVALRPLSRRILLPASYFRVGAAALERVRDEVEAWARLDVGSLATAPSR